MKIVRLNRLVREEASGGVSIDFEIVSEPKGSNNRRPAEVYALLGVDQ